MKRLAVMAHFDYSGEVAPHVERNVEALQAAVDDLVVVSTADLTESAAAWLSERATLLRRPNYGYDFLSYKTGLLHGGSLDEYDEVIIGNDSFVGPLLPYHDIFQAMSTQPVDFWGLTRTERVAPHVQSFFVAFRPWVVRSRAFKRFWSGMIPLSDRKQVILRYEVGMSGHLYDAGFTSGSYFTETPSDRRLARRRVKWWAAHRSPGALARSNREVLRRQSNEPWNPSAALADVALDDGRLPYVKIDTLRYDPYHLGADRLLNRCESRFPEHFAGVRDWLSRTAPFYPPRPAEVLHPTPMILRPYRKWVSY